MQDIDEKIRQALTKEDQQIIAELDRGTGLFELIGMSFKGKQAWLMYITYAAGLAVFLLLVYFSIRYFDTADVKGSLTWALGIITCMFMISLVKIMAWQQMLKLELLRELKRLEMRLMLAQERKQ